MVHLGHLCVVASIDTDKVLEFVQLLNDLETQGYGYTAWPIGIKKPTVMVGYL